jgi:hypothetical protein
LTPGVASIIAAGIAGLVAVVAVVANNRAARWPACLPGACDMDGRSMTRKARVVQMFYGRPVIREVELPATGPEALPEMLAKLDQQLARLERRYGLTPPAPHPRGPRQ